MPPRAPTDISTKYIGRCIGLTNLEHSCDDFLEIYHIQTPAKLRAPLVFTLLKPYLEISNFIRSLSNISDIAMCSEQSTQFRQIYITTTAQSYKLHFTPTAP
jgi:hypothetical protein